MSILLLSPRAVDAQIYADFSVSAGGSPLGTFQARLDHDKAPRTVANFVGLATGSRPWVDVSTNRVVRGRPYYDGRIFHRLIHNFMIQGGSSDGLGFTGSGYVMKDEFHPDLRHSGRYILSMAKSSLPGSGSAQFFITLVATPHLDDKHSVFGEVISGREIIDAFANPILHPTTGDNNRPVTEITLDSVTISGPSLDGFDIHEPALKLPVFKGVSPIPSRNAAASEFTLTFDRDSQHDYLYAYSLDLADWTSFRNILSIDSAPGYAFPVSGVPFDRFFTTLEAVDYSFLQNPTPAIISLGSSVRFTTRDGDILNLIPDGAGGGDWSYSDGSSGQMAGFAVFDGIGQSGTSITTSTQAQLIPLMEINFSLSSPSGPAMRSNHQVILDFREPTSGWSDGSAWTIGQQVDPAAFLHQFEIVPPPSD